MSTVKFEQEIGHREASQDCYGEYAVSVTRTLAGTMDEALQQWQKRFDDQAKFNDIASAVPAQTSQSERWRYWRVNLQNGTKILVNFLNKAPGKVLIQVQNEQLGEKKDIDAWKSLLDDSYKK